MRDHVGQRFELQRFQFVDDLANLDVPLFEQLVPILEVETGALQELRNAGRNLVRRDRNRAHVEIAVVNAVVDAVRRRHHADGGCCIGRDICRRTPP